MAQTIAPLRLKDLEDRITLSIEEVASLLGLGRTAAYEAARRGEIPNRRLGRRVIGSSTRHCSSARINREGWNLEVSPTYRSHCRPGTGATSIKWKPPTGATVSIMNRSRTDCCDQFVIRGRRFMLIRLTPNA